MALVSGRRSSLNPNAPLFVPVAVQQVEDFSREWWSLMTTSTWFQGYWLSKNGKDNVYGADAANDDVNDDDDDDDVVQLLPDSIDFGVDDDILNMEAQFEEFLQSSEAEYGSTVMKGVNENGFNSNALVKSVVSPRERVAKYPIHWEKPAKHVSPKCSPRFIQQPR